MEENIKNNSYTFLKTVCNFRSLNTNNHKVKQQIKEALNNPNLEIENIQLILYKKQLSNKDLINKINDELYNENPKQISIEKIQKICRKEDINNSRKISNLQREIILKNLQNSKIKEILSKEKPIYLILDNAKIHHAKIIESVCDILNMKLIFLEPYCPDLNPIEDVWRTIKRILYNSNYKTLEKLIKLFKKLFYEIVDDTSFYNNWLSEYFMV
ncbi:MAG: transposase [Methanosphaera stadtmanae]|jgi:transposase|nr:transposase [Methanosphaera stadtmanae]